VEEASKGSKRKDGLAREKKVKGNSKLVSNSTNRTLGETKQGEGIGKGGGKETKEKTTGDIAPYRKNNHKKRK